MIFYSIQMLQIRSRLFQATSAKLIFSIWAGLRHSVPSYLKTGICVRSEISLCLTTENIDFDVLQKKFKDYYALIKSRKAQFPKSSQHLRQAFNLSQEHLKKIFRLPHKVSFEPYIKAFQFKVLN